MNSIREPILLILYIILLWTLLGCKGSNGVDGKVFLTANWTSTVLTSPSYSSSGVTYTDFSKEIKQEISPVSYTLNWQSTNGRSYSANISLQKNEGSDGEIGVPFLLSNIGDDGDDNNYKVTFDDGSCNLTMNGSIISCISTDITEDKISPKVSSIFPTDSSSDVHINTDIIVSFSEALNITSVTINSDDETCSGSIQVSSDDFSSCVKISTSPGSSSDQKTFIVTPNSDLSYKTNYKVKITTSVKDIASNYLKSVYTTDNGFKTCLEPDTTAPTISSVSPADGSTEIAVNTSIAVTFSEAMNASTITTNPVDTICSGSFQVSVDDFTNCVQMSASPSTNNNKKTFTVSAASYLSYETTFKIKITTGTKDSANNALASEFNTSTGFTTGEEPDTDPPTVINTSPDDNSTDVAINTTVSVTFSEEMDVSTITANTTDSICSGSIQLSDDDFNSCITAESDPTTDSEKITFYYTPDTDLQYSTTHKIKVITDVEDIANNALTDDYISSTGFTTEEAPPTVIDTFPVDSSTDVPINTTISVAFSKEMDVSTITANTTDTNCSGTIQLSDDNFISCILMTGSPSSTNNQTFTISPVSDLQNGTTYKVKVSTSVKDIAGNNLTEDFLTFTGFRTVEVDQI